MKNLNLVPLCTICFREIKRIFRIWKQTFIPIIITTILYFVIFGKVIGQRIGEISGITYIEFIIPGIIIMNIILSSYLNSCFTFFSSKFQNYIEEILMSSMKTNQIILGFVIPSIFRSFVNLIILILISMFFTQIKIHSFSILILIFFLTSFLFSLLGLLNGIFANSWDSVNIVPNFVLTPLTYLSGIFFSIEMLSPFWQKISLLNPLYYIVDTFRYSFFGFTQINIYYGIFILIVLNIFIYSIIYIFLEKGYKIRN